MQVTQTATRNGWPGLMNIPLLGRLFQTNTKENKTEDLLVVMVPHIMRSAELTAANVRGVASGSDQVWKINYNRPETETPPAKPGLAPAKAPQAGVQPQAGVVAAPGAPAAGAPLNATAPAPPPEPPGTAPAPAETQPATPPEGATMEAISPELKEPAPAPEPPVAEVLMVPSAAEIKPGATVTVQVNVSNVKDLTAAPMKLKYDAAVLKLVEVKAGDFLGELGKQVIFSEVRSRQGGETRIQLQRLAGAGGVGGSGTLLTLKFEAKSAGTASISVADFSLRDSQLQPIKATPPQTSIVVK